MGLVWGRRRAWWMVTKVLSPCQEVVKMSGCRLALRPTMREQT